VQIPMAPIAANGLNTSRCMDFTSCRLAVDDSRVDWNKPAVFVGDHLAVSSLVRRLDLPDISADAKRHRGSCDCRWWCGGFGGGDFCGGGGAIGVSDRRFGWGQDAWREDPRL